MKCITLGILKCQDCDFKSNLSVKISKFAKIESSDSTCMMPFLHVFTDNNNELLNKIINDINTIENIQIETENQQKIYNFLDSIRIDEGTIICKECTREYPINNGIANFLQK
ncbi:hypothetical protein BDAP_000289 [Binucleata daphniae]